MNVPLMETIDLMPGDEFTLRYLEGVEARKGVASADPIIQMMLRRKVGPRWKAASIYIDPFMLDRTVAPVMYVRDAWERLLAELREMGES